MNLAIEYLIRSGAARSLFDTPCSLYIVGRYEADKIAITIDKGYTVRHWMLDLCSGEQALPPMTEFRVTDVFQSEAVVKPNYCLLQYQEDPIPSCKNTYREPMPGDEYCFYSDRFPLSGKHDTAKNCWLWRSFRGIYLSGLGLPTQTLSPFRSSKSSEEIVEEQQIFTAECYPKFWKYWQMWLKHMLPPSKVPGELVFSDSYSLDNAVGEEE